jgi:hypothetical protein
MMDGPYSMWTNWIDQPEHPGKYVVRHDHLPVPADRQPVSVTAVDSMVAAHAMLPRGLVLATRNERENPALLEMWTTNPMSIDN